MMSDFGLSKRSRSGLAALDVDIEFRGELREGGSVSVNCFKKKNNEKKK
jgi:hypothetical protein